MHRIALVIDWRRAIEPGQGAARFFQDQVGGGNVPIAGIGRHETGIDLFALIDVAEHVVAPLMIGPQVIDETALIIGYAGVYSTFFLFAKRAAEKYGVDTRDILLELGRQGVIGGQEDMIIDVALSLSRG